MPNEAKVCVDAFELVKAALPVIGGLGVRRFVITVFEGKP